jgi:hypothetical protein
MPSLVRAAAVAALLALPAAASAQEKPAAAKAATDVTGTWTYTVVTDNGTGEPTVRLVQAKDGKLTGSYASRMLGDRPLTGYVKGDSVVFVLEPASADAPALTYKGVLLAPDSIKGVVDFGGMGGATFTAKKQTPL